MGAARKIVTIVFSTEADEVPPDLVTEDEVVVYRDSGARACVDELAVERAVERG
jgi:hypothetical protein